MEKDVGGAVESIQSVFRGDPDASLGVLMDSQDEIRRETVAGGVASRDPIFHPEERRAGAHPERLFPIAKNRRRSRSGHESGDRQGRDCAVCKTVDLGAARADEEAAIAVQVQRADRIDGQSVPDRVVGEFSIREVAQPAIGADPEAAITIRAQDRDEIARQSFLRGVDGELAILEPAEATAVGADPEAPVIAFGQCPDFVLPQLVLIAIVEGREADAVESGQSALRPYPDVAVTRLENGTDLVLR